MSKKFLTPLGSVLWLAKRRVTPFGRKQRPGDQHRLKEEANQARGIGVESKGINPVDVLIDVAGKDQHKKERGDFSNQSAMLCQKDQGQTKSDLYHAGCHHHKICIQREPARHLREKFAARPGEVTQAGDKEKGAEESAQDWA